MTDEQRFREGVTASDYGKVTEGQFSGGQSNPMRERNEDFTALLLEGKLELTTPNGKMVLNPGDTWTFAAGVPFGERVLGDGPVRFLFATRLHTKRS